MRKKLSFFVSLLLVLPNFIMSRDLKKDLKITLEEKQIQKLSTTGVSLVFYVNITNSSSKAYYLSSYNYRFVVNQMEYLRLNTPLGTGIKIEASKNTLISIPVKITYELLFQNVPEVQDVDMAVCYLSGELAFSDGQRKKGSLPFAFSGEFPILKKPEVEFAALKVAMLTIGGADLTFQAIFKNRNGFELLVDRIKYNLKFGGYLISEGYLSGDKNIEKHGEKSFSVPLLLNFFDVGKDVYTILQQASVLCQFSGELEIRTIWGWIYIPFDKKETIAIIK